MNYNETLKALYDLQFSGIKLGLENTALFAKKLNLDQISIPIIHLAGTNGKGSTANMISEILQEEGKKVGLYTSPHILDFRERIQINKKMISEQEIVQFTAENYEFIKENKLTFFEVTTVLAVFYFVQKNVDVIVLETGLGGRLDSTSFFQPKITVITNVAMDHQEYLGNTIEKIAFEKAGIIKENIPLVCAEQNLSDYFSKQAKSKNSAFFHIQRKNYEKNQILYKNEEISIPLLGDHQCLNAETAIKSVEIFFEKKLNPEKIQDAFKKLKWRGRLEKWEKNENVFLDVSHNEAGVRETVETLKKHFPKTKFMIVYAFLDDKEKNINLKILEEISNIFYVYQFKNKRYQNQINDKIFPKGIDINEFLQKKKTEKMLVIGSHYLLEAFLKEN